MNTGTPLHGRSALRLFARCMGLLSVLVLLGGCLKDDVDPSTLTSNPFDPGYTGPPIFSFDTTYVELVTGPPSYARQVFQFKVNSALFLEPAAYSVYVQDPSDTSATYVEQLPPGSHTLRYYKLEYQQGVELCLTLHLANNFHIGRGEVICGTLQ